MLLRGLQEGKNGTLCTYWSVSTGVALARQFAHVVDPILAVQSRPFRPDDTSLMYLGRQPLLPGSTASPSSLPVTLLHISHQAAPLWLHANKNHAREVCVPRRACMPGHDMTAREAAAHAWHHCHRDVPKQ